MQFAVPEVQFLGHRVTADRIRPLQEKVSAIQKHPKPSTVKQLQALLGVINFLRHFMLVAAQTDTLKGSPKLTAAVEWTAQMEQAFSSDKSALCVADLLAHLRQGWELALMVDASASHMRAALQ